MIKRVIVVVVLLGISLFALTPLAQARFNSYHNGSAFLDWHGPQKGAQVYMDSQSFTLSGSGAFWRRQVEVSTSGWLAIIGHEEVNAPASNTFCSYKGSGNHSFWYISWPQGSTTFCTNYPSGTSSCTYGIEEKSGDNTHLWYDMDCGGGTGNCPNFSCQLNTNGYSIPASFSDILLDEVINDTWGGYVPANAELWSNNQWYSTSYGWNYQTVPGDCSNGGSGCPAVNNPPQMYWSIYPGAIFSYGGILVSCNRSDGNPVCAN